MTDEHLDAELRREFDAIFVPYDAMRAQHMIDRATQDVLTGSRTWGRPLAAAAAVLIVAGGGAALAANDTAPHHTPAGGSSSPVPTYSTPATPRTSPVPTPSCIVFADAKRVCSATPTESPAPPAPPLSTAPTPALTPPSTAPTPRSTAPALTPSSPVQSPTPSGPASTGR